MSRRIIRVGDAKGRPPQIAGASEGAKKLAEAVLARTPIRAEGLVADDAPPAHDRCMELVEIRRFEDLHPFDMIEEGVYVQRVQIGGGGNSAEALPMVQRAEWLDDPATCLVRPDWDGNNLRIITDADLPMNVMRFPPSPPIRCDLTVEPCDRCPRLNR